MHWFQLMYDTRHGPLPAPNLKEVFVRAFLLSSEGEVQKGFKIWGSEGSHFLKHDLPRFLLPAANRTSVLTPAFNPCHSGSVSLYLLLSPSCPSGLSLALALCSEWEVLDVSAPSFIDSLWAWMGFTSLQCPREDNQSQSEESLSSYSWKKTLRPSNSIP